MGTSDKTGSAERLGAVSGLIYGQVEGMTNGYSIEGRLTRRNADGGVVGSYSPDVMDRLLHYYNDAAAVGDLSMHQAVEPFVMAGEVIKD